MTLSNEEILAIARAQKGILWFIPANLFIPIVPYVHFLLTPFQILYAYRLAATLQGAGIAVHTSVFWMIGLFLPGVNLILMYRLAQKASALLRDQGVKVGWMGAEMLPLYLAVMKEEEGNDDAEDTEKEEKEDLPKE